MLKKKLLKALIFFLSDLLFLSSKASIIPPRPDLTTHNNITSTSTSVSINNNNNKNNIRLASSNIDKSTCNQLRAKAFLNGKFGVTGSITFEYSAETNAIVYKLIVSGLDNLNPGASYAYHVHTNPVGADGDCKATLEHLDPFNVGPQHVCDPNSKKLCQTGDLSGKYNKISGKSSPVIVQQVDPFLRFSPEEESFLGRSFVIHAPDSTRIACGNITSVLDGTEDLTGRPTFKPSSFIKRLRE
ncbi:superoxide dismutase [Phakopsora pachyrhizi]|uniref:superoxide dismutase n=1 Tax=Phakopsora pachyrhizi TaxID=170000 RepID=A0AAV0BBL4_PHAPC|nr:superoxide dismutase [Phakopsora pachyrhizi]CAH7683726.1 superoxide dismutase [Phakopsora pachyrhizi]